jgi:hypothetical protein
MATLTVLPRQTPAERSVDEIDVEVDEAFSIFAATLEDWAAPRPSWELELREGTEFGKTNNVEARLLFVAGEQTSSLSFRLDQLDRCEDTGSELVLVFEEQDGIAKLVTCTTNGLDVELFHILTFT